MQEAGRKMDGPADWQGNKKQKEAAEERCMVGKKKEHQQNELVQLIKQEARSVKHYQSSPQVRLAADICGQAVV